MKFHLALTTFVLLLLLNQIGLSQDLVQYKTVEGENLFLEVYNPENLNKGGQKSAIIFFFGGGWNGGTRAQFEHHAKYLSQRGMVCFLADYRTKKSHGTSPIEAVKDAKSALRFLRANASKFQIDPDRIIASGGSAGGHLAATTALIKDYDDENDDLEISAIPDALVLFNPVIDNGPGGYGFERIGEAYPQFSPLHNIREGAPPTIIFLGTKDPLIPVSTVQYYKTVMEKVGSWCEVRLYEDQVHGFFNYKNFEIYKETVQETDDFLVSLGFLNVEPKVEIE
jgi:acetyl esterase/lipase